LNPCLALISALLPCVLASATCAAAPVVRLELIPPSPVTDKITLDLRGAVQNTSYTALRCRTAIYIDRHSPDARVEVLSTVIAPHGSVGISHRLSTEGLAGTHKIILDALCNGNRISSKRTVVVLPSHIRSTRTIDGAWAGIVHWSNDEAKYWNADIRRLTDADWRQQVRGMHRLGMDTIVIQEVFRNEAYQGDGTIAAKGYHGLAYYPSRLYPGRVAMTAHDPIEAILTQADHDGMNVFLGIGAYAWFDFSPEALTWSKQVAAELWQRYGHHPSFYGWYVSAEAYGSLVPDRGATDLYRRQMVDYFVSLRSFCRSLAPEKPIMLAPNAHGMLQSQTAWPAILQHLDIVCPFAFHRMPAGDITGEQAAAIWQSMCDKAGTHLWLDMEAFVFDDKALVPRPIAGLLQDMQRFPNFEKILCYQYPGIFNQPGLRITPGGPATVTLFQDYSHYLESIGRAPSASTP